VGFDEHRVKPLNSVEGLLAALVRLGVQGGQDVAGKACQIRSGAST